MQLGKQEQKQTQRCSGGAEGNEVVCLEGRGMRTPRGHETKGQVQMVEARELKALLMRTKAETEEVDGEKAR